ncbi:MAG: peroxiredoxin [Thermoanaerobaculum sp.]
MRWARLSLVFLSAMAPLLGAAGPLPEGSVFPAWELVDQFGRKVSSKELAGKTYLIWFYPKAGTPGCTKEGCELRDNFEEFKKLGVQVVGVSFDTPEENAAFAARHRFPFPLLSDSRRELAVKVGAADTPEQGYPRRISYLVGADGRVLKVYPQVNPERHAREVLADLHALAGK